MAGTQSIRDVFTEEVEVHAEPGRRTIGEPARSRAGWAEAARTMAAASEDERLL